MSQDGSDNSDASDVIDLETSLGYLLKEAASALRTAMEGCCARSA